MKLSKLLSYLLLPIHKPNEKLQLLIHDQRKVVYGFISLLLIGILYTITVYIGYRNGFGAVVTPFLAIPAEDYYFWEPFFALPVFILIAIVFAGLCRLVALIFNGNGSFENIFSIYCLSITLPMFLTMWLPESTLIIFFASQRATELGGFRIFPIWIDALRQIIGIVWPLIITILGIKLSERMNWGKSILVAIIAFIPTSLLMIIFIR